MQLYLLDPAPEPAWFPYSDSRPLSELRAGAWLVRERWEAVAGVERTTEIFSAPHLHGFEEDDLPGVVDAHAVEGPALVGRSDFAPAGYPADLPDRSANLLHEGRVVGWWVSPDDRWESDKSFDQEVEIEGMVLHGAYDLITALEHFLPGDVADITQETGDPLPDGSIILGDPADVVLLGAAVEPGAVFDVRRGAVVLEQHSYVRAGTRLEGPLFVGPGTELLGGEIKQSCIGPGCKVRGEIAHAVFLGYGNKAHEGFLGHSVVGRWANLGAGTITSNLKNTYGQIRLDVAGTRIETGRMNLGSLVGDHAKTAIGTLLPTGAAIGTGANVFDEVRTRKYIPPFAWGNTGDLMDRTAFVQVAERVLPRRNVPVTEGTKEMLRRIYDHATR